MVEPIAGVIGALLVVYIEKILPYALSFAAGAMILVAVHELIPECQQNQEKQPYFSTSGIIAGFATMMLLDVMLGGMAEIVPKFFGVRNSEKTSKMDVFFAISFYISPFGVSLCNFERMYIYF